jgi:glutaminyl-peptide cyclotransferase
MDHKVKQQRSGKFIFLVFISVLSVGCGVLEPNNMPSNGLDNDKIFNPERAYRDVLKQESFGPRIPGSSGHQEILIWMVEELAAAGWETKLQILEVKGKPIRNLIAWRGDYQAEHLLLGAHYDTRIYADQDPDLELRDQPVPGANDGASGVAVLLEMARVLPKNPEIPVKLVFFDAEDNGGIGDYDWILGSTGYAESREEKPLGVVIVDMIGDRDLNIHYEQTSDPVLQEQIWDRAHSLGYGEAFIRTEKYAMLDDHTPFLEAGIPAVDIIDFDYPYWHTTTDTSDKVAPESLEAVGVTLVDWLQDIERSDLIRDK